MSPLSSLPNANGRTLKRSFTAVTVSTPPTIDSIAELSAGGFQARKTRHRCERAVIQAPFGKKKGHHHPKMPSAAGPRMYETHIPSFMSVYDMDTTLIEGPNLAPSTTNLSETSYTNQESPEQQPVHLPDNDNDNTINQIHSHQHRTSTSTQASDSNDSSPTTTISTIDSSSLSDPSPSSSPESPITLVPLSSFSGSTFGLDSFQSLRMGDINPIRKPLTDERPMTSPGPRKSKNLKSLALNLNSNIDSFQGSEPSSPSFIKPPPLKARKKPSLLSLNTGTANKLSLSMEPLASPSVPTMLQRRGLKHSISSPQILATPGFGPSGGMSFGERRGMGASRLKDLSTNTFTIDEDIPEAPAGVQMATRVPGVSVGGDSFDRPLTGEDCKSPSYPDGPILMHEPSVHLYLEPKIEEAMKFDVVINVAREVKNPFKVLEEEESAAKEREVPKSSDVQTTTPDAHSPQSDTAASMLSFQTAFEAQPPESTESSPTTPKPMNDAKRPEYIHMPWDHNTDVKDELWDLCQTIESRTKEGKRVLVHCQQGASRSATLIIAYGMYINQDLGPTEAYSQAQARSRWVNPNMSLLFSLNDFKKVIEKKKVEKNNAIRKPPTKHRPSLSADTLDLPTTPTRLRGNSTPSILVRDAALTKAGENKDPSATDSAIERLASFDFGFGDTSRTVQQPNEPQNQGNATSEVQLPIREANEPQPFEFSNIEQQPQAPMIERQRPRSDDWEELMSPRVTEMTTNPIESFSRSLGSSQGSVAPTRNMFPPRAFDFPASSFLLDAANPRASLPPKVDPRSPPTKGEAPIIRSIDDFL